MCGESQQRMMVGMSVIDEILVEMASIKSASTLEKLKNRQVMVAFKDSLDGLQKIVIQSWNLL
jgi:hypothetical protein